MKKLISSFVLTAALFVAAACPMTASAEGGRHPEIMEAIHALEKAKQHLQEAKHEFGGHRRDAVEAIDKALFQLHLALEADR